MRGKMTITTRLLLSHVLVLVLAATVAFGAAALLAPVMLERHARFMDESQPMGAQMRERMGDSLRSGDPAYLPAMRQAMLLGLAVALPAAGIASLLLSRRISLPLRAMQRASRQIAQGSYEQRLSETAPGEIGELAAAFNHMAARLESTEQRRRDLIADAAHEFRTPLASLRGYVEGLADGHFSLGDGTVAACSLQLARLAALVDDLSQLSRVEAQGFEVYPEAASLHTVLQQATAALRARFREKGVELELVLEEQSDAAWFDPRRTHQILENLLTNALRHTPAGGRVRVATRPLPPTQPHPAKPPLPPTLPQVEVAVTDSGEGIPVDEQTLVFERFYRGDRSRTRAGTGDRSGSGIGLTIARALVVAQGGSIQLHSSPGQGTEVRFTVPTRAPA